MTALIFALKWLDAKWMWELPIFVLFNSSWLVCLVCDVVWYPGMVFIGCSLPSHWHHLQPVLLSMVSCSVVLFRQKRPTMNPQATSNKTDKKTECFLLWWVDCYSRGLAFWLYQTRIRTYSLQAFDHPLLVQFGSFLSVIPYACSFNSTSVFCSVNFVMTHFATVMLFIHCLCVVCVCVRNHCLIFSFSLLELCRPQRVQTLRALWPLY